MADNANVVVETIHRPPASGGGPGPGEAAAGDFLDPEAYLPEVDSDRLYMKEGPDLACAWGGGEVTLSGGNAATSSEDEDENTAANVHTPISHAPLAKSGGDGMYYDAVDGATAGEQILANGDEDERLIIVEEVPEEGKFMFTSPGIGGDGGGAGSGADSQHIATPSPSSGSGAACEICGKVFRQLNTLEAHMRTHFSAKPHACEVCGKAFSRVSLLNEHKRLHGDSLQFVCHLCGKCYRWNSSLHLHLQTHSDKKEHVCYVCNRAFRWRIALRRHMTEHAEESPFKCPTCHKCFSDSYSLTQHARVHTGERPFSCPDCGRTFRWKHQITQHACAARGGSGCSPKKRRSAPATPVLPTDSGFSAADSAATTTATAASSSATSSRTRRSNAGNLYTMRKAAEADGGRYAMDMSSTMASREGRHPTRSDNGMYVQAPLPPPPLGRLRAPPACMLSISNTSGLAYTCRLSNISSEHDLCVSADASAVHDRTGSRLILPPTGATARVVVDADGRRKLMLTLPEVAVDVLLQNQGLDVATPALSPASALAHTHMVRADRMLHSVKVEAVDDDKGSVVHEGGGGDRRIEVPLFRLQSMPTPDVTLGTPLML